MSIDTKKSRDRIVWARDALETLKASSGSGTFRKAWTEFLLHANGVYTQLEQACKTSRNARQWYGAKKRERKEDDLMQYLHHARNSNEHSVEEITEFFDGGLGIGVAREGFASGITLNTQPDGSLRVDSIDGKPVLIEAIEPHYRLRAVTDRGVRYSVPTRHLGKPLSNTDPVYVAEMGLSLINGLVEEAEAKFS